MSDIIKLVQCILELFTNNKELISLITVLLILLRIYLKYKNEINNFVKKYRYITKNFVNKIKDKRIDKQIKKYLKYKIKKYYNCNIDQFISKECPSLLNYLLKQKEKKHGSLYNFVSKEYPDVLKEYTEKEIIKHDSILDFLKEKYPEDENLKNKYEDYIKSEINSRDRDLISRYKLRYKQFSIVYVILYCNCTEAFDFYDMNYIGKIANEMLEITEKYASYFNEYVLEMAWIKLRNMYLLKYATLKRCENFYKENHTYIKKIEEIFNKAKQIKMENSQYDIGYDLDSIQIQYDRIKDIEIPNEYKSKYNKFIEKVNENLKELDKFKIKDNYKKDNYQEEIKGIDETIKGIDEIIKDIDEIINEKTEDEILTKYKECIAKIKEQYKYIKRKVEELNLYSIEFNKDNYIKAHKAFINNIIEDTEFYELINFGRAEYYVSYYPYDADVFLYDINIDIDDIDKDNIQKVFTLYQELCIDVLKIYLSGKSNEDNRIDKYMKNISKLYDIINESNNEMLKSKAEKLKLCLEELGLKVDNTLHILPKAS